MKREKSVLFLACFVCAQASEVMLAQGLVPVPSGSPGGNPTGSIVGCGEHLVGADLSQRLGAMADGSIVAWGWNDFGQCNVPEPNANFVAVAAATWHSLGLKDDGAIAAWGSNHDWDGDYVGQCDVPAPNANFVAVAAATWHSLGLKADGSIVAWGYGQTNVPAPNTGFVALAAGSLHNLGLKADDGSPGACCFGSSCTSATGGAQCGAGGGVWHAGEDCATFHCPPESPIAYVPPPELTPLSRLGRWDGTTFQLDVLPGSISAGNVHVLVHGWGKGEIEHANLPAWDSEVSGSQTWKDLAAAIRSRDVALDTVILMYNWLDDSATEDCPPDPCGAWRSRDRTDINGGRLSVALQQALTQPFNGKVHLIGFSHGARVATIATQHLQAHADPTMHVAHLTLLDSPDVWYSWAAAAANSLDQTLRVLDIGRQPGKTFVDNCFSSYGLGRRYGVSNGLDARSSLVDVALESLMSDTIEEHHQYPKEWYTKASRDTVDRGVGWSPLVGTLYQELDSLYHQEDWVVGGVPDLAKELILIPHAAENSPLDPTETAADLIGYLTEGTVLDSNGGIELVEGGGAAAAGATGTSALWYATLNVSELDSGLAFRFKFLEQGDGDQLGVWVDEDLRFVMTGTVAGTSAQSSLVELEIVAPGTHVITVALHASGENNARVWVGDFRIIKAFDCNGNGTPDDQDIGASQSADSNRNGVPDECDLPGDMDGDGGLGLGDLDPFASCMTGPETAHSLGCGLGDIDGDADVDLRDFAIFQVGFAGSAR